MKAVNDFIIVEASKLGVRKSESGLEFAESLDDESRYRRGIVRTSNELLNLNDGDEVLYDKQAGNGSPELPERYLIMRLRDIAIVL